jgi:hypothetical protein
VSTITMLQSPQRNDKECFDKNEEESGMLCTGTGTADEMFDFSFFEYHV